MGRSPGQRDKRCNYALPIYPWSCHFGEKGRGKEGLTVCGWNCSTYPSPHSDAQTQVSYTLESRKLDLTRWGLDQSRDLALCVTWSGHPWYGRITVPLNREGYGIREGGTIAACEPCARLAAMPVHSGCIRELRPLHALLRDSIRY